MKAGQKVVNQFGIKGTVLENGPYGDNPYQVLDDTGLYHAIEEDGKSCFNEIQWRPLDNEKA